MHPVSLKSGLFNDPDLNEDLNECVVHPGVCPSVQSPPLVGSTNNNVEQPMIPQAVLRPKMSKLQDRKEADRGKRSPTVFVRRTKQNQRLASI